MTVTRAKAEYKLTDKDLAQLTCVTATKPHGRSAAPMRLYRIQDLEAASNKKHGSPVKLQARKEAAAAAKLKAAETR